jgi:hypothetical protein
MEAIIAAVFEIIYIAARAAGNKRARRPKAREA